MLINKTGYMCISVHPPENIMIPLTARPISVRGHPTTNNRSESHLGLLDLGTT